MDSIGSNIISTLGAGSGIDTRGLAEQLSEIEKSSRQNAIDSRRETLETQISDFGLLRSALATLQDSVELLGDESFGAMTASFTDSDALTPTDLGDNAPPGDYTFEVLALARAQSLSTDAVFDDPTDAVGTGTLTFDFGAWDATTDNFTVNGDRASQTITIDESNNSLSGLRDAINAADMGVQASIVNDGSGYRLLLTAPSGEDNQLRISVAEEGGAATNTDASDLSRFAFGAGAANQQMVQNQAGASASVSMNGFTFTRDSNEIDDILEDFTFTLNQASPGELINISIAPDKTAAETAVRDFVDVYNTFLETIKPALETREVEDEDGNTTTEQGSLRFEATAKSMLSQLRSQISAEMAGVDGGFNALATVGIRTELDGTLSIDEDTFSSAFEDNFEEIKDIFAPATSSDNDRVVVNGFGDNTTPGNYEVVITQDPSKGGLVGAASSGTLLTDLAVAQSSGTFTGAASAFASTDLSAANSGDYAFDIAVDGGSVVTITLAPDNYADESAIATALQSEFDSNGVAASIVHNGSEFVVTSNSGGANSSVAISNVQELTPGEFGLAAGVASAGSGPNDDDYSFTVNVNGTSALITIPPDTYASEDELASVLQAQINGNEALSTAGADVDVVWNVDHFEIASRDYGASSTVVVTDVGANAADLGLSAGVTTTGTDVEGTVNGDEGFGVGNVLLPAFGSAGEGLKLVVREGAGSANVSFSRGFAGQMNQLIDSFLKTNGTFALKESSLEQQLDSLDEDQDRLDRRTEAYFERLLAQFQAMESILNGLTNSGSALEDIATRLPFTSEVS